MVRIILPEQDRARRIESVTRILVQLSWAAQKLFANSVAEQGLTFPQYLTLAFLVKAQHHCSMNELAAATHQDAATMTGVVDRLERLELVERARSLKDRRVVLVRPTASGLRRLAAIKLRRDQMMSQLFAEVADESLFHLEAHLDQLWGLVERQARSPARADCPPARRRGPSNA